MMKFINSLFAFFLVLVVFDVINGGIFSWMISHAKGGEVKHNSYVADRMTDDIVLMGSSRCTNHYDPRIIGEKLGISCYNAGQDGNGILMFYPLYRMAAERYTPKVLVYDVVRVFDLEKGDNSKYLGWLRLLYNHPAADSMIWKVAPTERWKMLCHTYRYNGKAIQNFRDCTHPRVQDIKGFKPNYGTMLMAPDQETESPLTPKNIDSLKLFYLEKLITDCQDRGTKVCFAVSPLYNGKPNNHDMDAVRRLCYKYHVTLLYHYADSRFVHDRSLWHDSWHMNIKGAERYSRIIAREIGDILKLDNNNHYGNKSKNNKRGIEDYDN